MSAVVIGILGTAVLGMLILLVYLITHPRIRTVTKVVEKVVEKEIEETPAIIQPVEFREIIVKVEEEAEGKDNGRVQLLTLRPGQEAFVGKEGSNEIVVNDGFASRKHAVITYDDSGWKIRDNRSRNGLVVDGQDVMGASANLHDGSVVELGEGTKIHFHGIPSAA